MPLLYYLTISPRSDVSTLSIHFSSSTISPPRTTTEHTTTRIVNQTNQQSSTTQTQIRPSSPSSPPHPSTDLIQDNNPVINDNSPSIIISPPTNHVPITNVMQNNDVSSPIASRSPIVNVEPSTTRPRIMPPLPSFISPPGTLLCVSILALARADGYDSSLTHGQRTPWFESKLDTFFASGGILCQYRVTNSNTLRRKFKDAEKYARDIYDSRTHQADDTSVEDESQFPSFVLAFFDYFKFCEERNTTLNTARHN